MTSSTTKPILNIVFSRNRALQLEALLRSIRDHDPESLHQVRTVVLHRYDPGPHQKSLEEVAKEHPWAEFLQENPPESRPSWWGVGLAPKTLWESPFKRQVEDLFRQGHENGCARHAFAMFMVDDMIVKGPTPWLHVQEVLHRNPSVLSVQLRLGEGITECYPLQRSQAVPHLRDFQIWKLWKWWGSDGDWGYPLNVDGSVFRSDTVWSLLSGFEYTNPNTLEANMQAGIPQVSNTVCACLSTSRVLNVPANRVQDEFKNRVMSGCSAADLLTQFQTGQRIDIAPFLEINNNDAHFEFDFTLVQPATQPPR